MNRPGNAMIIVLVILGVGAGAVAMSPDIAQSVLPGQALAMLPQFETVETDISCTDIEEGTEAVNQWVPPALRGGEEIDPGKVKTEICNVRCRQYKETGGTYCSGETLSCVCRKAQ